MATTNVPSANIGMSDLADACGVTIQTNLSLNGLRAGNGGDLSTSDTDSGETLAESIDTNDTSFNVSDGSVFTDEYIRIDSEYMKISHVSGDTLTVAREESSIRNLATDGSQHTGDFHTNNDKVYHANPFVPYAFPDLQGLGGGSPYLVAGYLLSWLVENDGEAYGTNTTNIGMKLTFYTNAGSGRAADLDGYLGR